MTTEEKINQAQARIQVYTELIVDLQRKRAADSQIIADLERENPKEKGN